MQHIAKTMIEMMRRAPAPAAMAILAVVESEFHFFFTAWTVDSELLPSSSMGLVLLEDQQLVWKGQGQQRGLQNAL